MENGAKKLREESVGLDVRFQRPGVRRKGDMSMIETDGDKTMLGLSKQILDSPAYKKVCKIAHECRQSIERLALPSPLRRGTYLIPLKLLDRVYAQLQESIQEHDEAREDFLAGYPVAIETAKGRLGVHFDPQNYPPVEHMRSAMWVEHRLIEFGLPGENKLGEYIYAQEREKAVSH